MKYTIVSDIHGQTHWLDKARQICPESSLVQIGDFGMGFNGRDWERDADQWNVVNDARFIRGNHDDPAVCKSSMSWIKDGHYENDVMFIGGAWSIDSAYRTPGYTWWPDEELSDQEFEVIHNKYCETKPKFMVTHDAPHSLSQRMFWDHGHIKRTRTSYWLDAMFFNHKPVAWIFGHWHLSRNEYYQGTEFRCLAIGEAILLDTEKPFTYEAAQ